MKPLEFVEKHKIEIGVGIVAATAITFGFAYGYKVGSHQGVRKFVGHLWEVQNEAKKINDAIPVIIGTVGTDFEIPIKICPDASIIDGFVENTSLTKVF